MESDEASSTAMTSATTGPWARAEETASPTSPASLYAMTTTETVGRLLLFTRWILGERSKSALNCLPASVLSG